MITPQPTSGLTAAVDADPAAGGAHLLHSHHYHAVLLRALFEAEGIDGGAILIEGVDACESIPVSARPGTPLEPGWRRIESDFRRTGLGRLSLEGMTPSGSGTAEVRDSHFAQAWRVRYPHARSPICAPVAGLLGRLLSDAVGGPLIVTETRCAAQGDRVCAFRITAASGERPRPAAFPVPEVGWEEGQNPLGSPERVSSLLGSSLTADEVGVIHGPGGPFAMLPADFYATVSRRFELEVPRCRGAKFGNLPGILLMEAAHRNGFHLFGEILSSRQWVEEIAPQLDSESARLEALLRVPGCLGWGDWDVHSFVPGERLTVRISDSYEGVAHERLFGRSEQPRCSVARGAAAALMNLLYRATEPGATALTGSAYNALFRSPHSFRAVETRCRAQGDSYCELVVNPLTV